MAILTALTSLHMWTSLSKMCNHLFACDSSLTQVQILNGPKCPTWSGGGHTQSWSSWQPRSNLNWSGRNLAGVICMTWRSIILFGMEVFSLSQMTAKGQHLLTSTWPEGRRRIRPTPTWPCRRARRRRRESRQSFLLLLPPPTPPPPPLCSRPPPPGGTPRCSTWRGRAHIWRSPPVRMRRRTQQLMQPNRRHRSGCRTGGAVGGERRSAGNGR